MDTTLKDSSDTGATVVITHKVREGKHVEYETWQREIAHPIRYGKTFAAMDGVTDPCPSD